MLYMKYEVVPAADHPRFGDIGGAFASCFLNTVSKKQAKQRALRNFAEQGWKVVAIEEGPFATERSDYLGDDDWLLWFDAAQAEGESYVFFEWPKGAEEDD